MSTLVVLGGNPEAWVAAQLLSRAGHRVTLFNEGRPAPPTAEGWVAPQIVRDLGVELAVRCPDPWAVVPVEGGAKLELWNDVPRTAEALRRFSPRDAARWPEFCRRMSVLSGLLADLYLAPPVAPLDLGFAVKVRRLGRESMEDLMRILPMPVAELLDDWFECDALKGALGAIGIRHLQQGPRSAGTAFRLLHHHVGSPAGVFRPPRTNLPSVLANARGVEQRPAAVAGIRVRDGRATGVVLASGEEVPADAVVSGLDPRRTLLELTDPAWLDPELARALTHVRRRGVAARIAFPAGEGPLANLVIAPSLDYLERAYDEAKYGRASAAPYLEAHTDEGRVEVHFQFAPYRLAEGEWDTDTRSALGERARSLLAPHLRGIEDARPSVQAPSDLEGSDGWPEGQAYHAELTLDQALWMRPLPELARYRTPIEGLWLCGPGMHPGGGVVGAAGYNCARALLSQLGKR